MRVISKRLRPVQLLKMATDTGKTQVVKTAPMTCIVQSPLSADFWIDDEVYKRIVAKEQAEAFPAWLL